MDKEYILDVLKYYLSVVKEERNNTVFGLFLKGSQNYNLDTKTSDIDVIALLIPTKEILIMNRKLNPHSITTQYGIISIMDIRDFAKSLLNGNPQMLEILNTEFYVIENDDNNKKWGNLKSKSLYFEYINPQGTLLALQGQMRSYYKKFKESEEANGKNLMHLARLNDLIFSWCGDACMHSQSYYYKMKAPPVLKLLRDKTKTPVVETYADSLFEEVMKMSYCENDYPIPYHYAEKEVYDFIWKLLCEELKIK